MALLALLGVARSEELVTGHGDRLAGLVDNALPCAVQFT
jgi:hypothetical protein